jgi:hypothetical protein
MREANFNVVMTGKMARVESLTEADFNLVATDEKMDERAKGEKKLGTTLDC